MNQRVALVAATEKEIDPLVNYLRQNADQHSFQTFQLHGLLIDIIYSGIGILQTTYTLMDYINHRHPNGWIQAGIGGSLNAPMVLGDVYQITSERLSGFGAQDQEGRIMDPAVLGWNDPHAFPYIHGILECPYQTAIPLPSATGMTTFYAHGHQKEIEMLLDQPHGQVENMEGAPFFFISLVKKIPFLSIRSISNRVETRDIGKWKMDLAIQNLNQFIINLLNESRLNPDRLFRLVQS